MNLSHGKSHGLIIDLLLLFFRSNEILIPDNGLISTDLELHFSLQVHK